MLKPSTVFMGTGMLLMAAFSASNNYSLQNYGIGSGGSNNASSTSYKLNASSGEISGAAGTGTSNVAKPGSTETRQANVPLAPTLSNGTSSYYNKLNCIINKGGSDATDYTYAIATSINSYATTLYVQADGTLGAAAVFQTYASWGGAAGTFITGLSPSTAYQAKVTAMQGTFSQSAYGPVASASTVSPSLTFSLTPNNLSLGNLLPGNIVTSSTITIGFATNGAAGGNVYIAGQNTGLHSATGSYTIPALTNDLSTQTQGVGVQGLSASQSSGGAFTIASPFNTSGSNIGAYATTFKPVFTSSTALAGGSATASIKAKASTSTVVATDYQETLTFIASASF
jgi:hypothetical protein